MRKSRIAETVLYTAGGMARQRSRYFKLAVWKAAHQIANMFSGPDDVVRVPWYGVDLFTPVNSTLTSVRSISPDYDKSLASVIRAVSRKYPSAPIIDVGANIGDTAAIILMVSPPVAHSLH